MQAAGRGRDVAAPLPAWLEGPWEVRCALSGLGLWPTLAAAISLLAGPADPGPTVGPRRSTTGPWNGSSNGRPRNSRAISAIGVMSRAICAGHAIGAREQATRNASLTEGWYVPCLVGSSWGEATAHAHRSGWRSAWSRARESCSASTCASLSWTRRRAGTPTPRPFSARSISRRYRFNS
jgi:hypothetical protein